MIETKDKASDVRVLVSWRAPARIPVKHNRDWYVTLGVVVFLVIVIFVLLRMFLEIALVLSLSFAMYALYSSTPEETDSRITTQGLTTGGRTYIWEELRSFWFETKYGHRQLVVETRFGFPRLIFAVLSPEMKTEDIIYTLTPYLSYREFVEPTFLDKAAQWLTRSTFPDR